MPIRREARLVNAATAGIAEFAFGRELVKYIATATGDPEHIVDLVLGFQIDEPNRIVILLSKWITTRVIIRRFTVVVRSTHQSQVADIVSGSEDATPVWIVVLVVSLIFGIAKRTGVGLKIPLVETQRRGEGGGTGVIPANRVGSN